MIVPIFIKVQRQYIQLCDLPICYMTLISSSSRIYQIRLKESSLPSIRQLYLMKSQEKKRKQKVQFNKIVNNLVPQKLTSKKTSVKKNEVSSSKSTANIKQIESLSPVFSRGDTLIGSNTSQQSKFIQQSLRTSPKASLADIKAFPIQKKPNTADVKKSKTKFSQKTKNQIKNSLANVIKMYHSGKKSFLDISLTQNTTDLSAKDQKISRYDFNFIETIGQGGYGKVWKVEHLKTKKYYALKEMSKALIIMKKSVENILNERKILQKINSLFIANMICAFNDRDNLYLLLDLLPGGDLRVHMGEISFNEDQAKFIIACLLIGLHQIHTKSIFHRDIKPQNLVIDNTGYVRITDFGIARCQTQKQALDASGTPGYMAPQVIYKQMHSYAVDFYAVGIITYQLMLGKRPYYGNNRAQIRELILAKQHQVKKTEIPRNWSLEVADFINKLIQRNPGNRLGSQQGVKQLLNHPWFRGYPWEQLRSKTLISPLRRKINNFMQSNYSYQNDQQLIQYRLLQRVEEKLDAFATYNYRFRQI